MYVILGILAVIALGGIVYLFLSKESSHLLKMVALGALILSGIALGICGAVLIFGGDEKGNDLYAFPLDPTPVEPEGMSDTTELIIFLLMLFLIFGFIVFLGLREKKKHTAVTGKGKT
jgi:cytochrome bd-type quinol oxidase subunit 2